jgi:hypothetical protein
MRPTLTLLLALLSFAQAIYAQNIMTYDKGKRCGYRLAGGDDITKAIFDCCGSMNDVGSTSTMIRTVVGMGKVDSYTCQKYALINAKGELLTEYKYDQIVFNPSPRTEALMVRVGQQYGVISTATGKEIVPVGSALDIRDIVKVDNGQLHSSKTGVWTDRGTIQVKNLNGRWGMMDLEGNIVVPQEYDSIIHVKTDRNNWSYYQLLKDGKKGIIQFHDGKPVVIPAVYDEFGAYAAEQSNPSIYLRTRLAVAHKVNYGPVYFGHFIIARNAKGVAVYDHTGTEVVPCCDPQPPIHPASSYVRLNEGKIGVVDFSGDTIVPVIYDEVIDLALDNKNWYNGCKSFVVKKDGLWGLISESGAVLLPPTYTSYVMETSAPIKRNAIGFVHANGTDVTAYVNGCAPKPTTLKEFYVKDKYSGTGVPQVKKSAEDECITCTVCEGTGLSRDKVAEYEKCPICAGSGWNGYHIESNYTGRDHSRWFGGPGYQRSRCTTCKGTGKAFAGRKNLPCRVCSGVGCTR